MSSDLSRLQILSLWIELEKNYTAMLHINLNYMNHIELNRQMLLTSMFLTKQKEFLNSMNEVEEINGLLATAISPSDIEKLIIRRSQLSDFITYHITPPEYFPYSIDEIISYIEKIENHQKLLHIPY
jgi:hypothetical protein